MELRDSRNWMVFDMFFTLFFAMHKQLLPLDDWMIETECREPWDHWDPQDNAICDSGAVSLYQACGRRRLKHGWVMGTQRCTELQSLLETFTWIVVGGLSLFFSPQCSVDPCWSTSRKIPSFSRGMTMNPLYQSPCWVGQAWQTVAQVAAESGL